MPIFLRPKRRAPHPQSQSRLFSLPAELRIKIFTLALTSPPIPLAVVGPRNDFHLVLATPGSGGPDVNVIQAQRLLSLLQTCVRAHAEALQLLYSINTFDREALARRLYAGWTSTGGWTSRQRNPVHAGRAGCALIG
ncbi:hypothetical protein OIDMADRAFT_35233 [Oidiodendron maius Zn]|uniref:DUF7730 domain-containing protein n=1 Tax=Oidiodendron maius (strain Zn) TaxID=913774 RepID=A0A0C3C5P1_OIDMZ|nr:hypothetical protein OIDMADRAFT_35233 [Oidiodendron maius Zn]